MSVSLEVPFLVIGGGIGGLAAALAIGRTGRSVHVLERAPEFNVVGAGLQLGPNATRVLNKLGVLDSLLEYAVLPKRLVLKDAMTGGELSALDLGESFLKRYGSPYIVAHRHDLLNVLLDACKSLNNVTLHTNKDVVSIVQVDEQFQVSCADGTTFLAETAVGADGIRSKTRQLIVEDNLISYPFVTYRGTVPVSEISSQVNMNDVTVWTGPGLHFVAYPVHRGEIYNLAAIFKSSHFQEDNEDWGTVEELEEHFSKCCSDVRNGLTYIKRDRHWKLYDRDPIANWTLGRFTLLGDAAHPMLQNLAQGACQGLEDAGYLAEQIELYGSDIEKAFSAYQQERTERTARVQRNARTMGDIYHMQDPMAILMRNSLLARRKADDYSDVDWLYA